MSNKNQIGCRSTSNERAVAFNLQLDVQNLQQQVRNLTALRDILQTKTLLQRHAPDGSLMQVVHEYFRVFRASSMLEETAGKRAISAQDQRAFLYSITDADVDAGGGLRGPEVMLHQVELYSTFIRWIRLEMHSFEIVQAEDSVVIQASASLRFQVLRETIEMVFPHVMGNERLVSQLVGQEVEPDMDITFFFNAEGKCSKMSVNTDFVGAFTRIVKDLEVVDMLMGRALIGDNGRLGLTVQSPELEEKEAVPASKGSQDSNEGRAERDTILRGGEYELRGRHGGAGHSTRATTPPKLMRESESYHAQTACLRVVKDYYLAFASGFLGGGSADCADLAVAFQHDFLLHRFESMTAQVNFTSPKYVASRWRSLSTCFSVLRFHQKAAVSVECHDEVGQCVVNSAARYTLRITSATIQAVFPHIAASPQLCEAIQGEVLAVPSEICFSIAIGTGRICRIEERMDFVTAMAKLGLKRHVLEFVLSEAKLEVDGVTCLDEAAGAIPPSVVQV